MSAWCGAGAAVGVLGRPFRLGRGDLFLQIGDERILERRRIAGGGEFVRRADREHAPGMHQRYPVAPAGLVHEVGGDEDGHAVVARQFGQKAPERVARDRVDAGGRLVEDQHFGAMDHGGRELKPLTDAERQVFRRRVGIGFEIEALHQVRDARTRLVVGQVEQAGMQVHVLAHRQLAIEREGLRDIADAAPGLHVAGVEGVSEQLCDAVAYRQKPGEHLHRRRLAAAVGAQKTEYLSACDLETHIVDGGEVAEPLGEANGAYRRCAVAGRPRRDLDGAMLGALFFGQEFDEGGVEAFRSRALLQLVRGAGGDDLAVVHGDQPVEAFGLFHIGGRDHDAHARPALPDALDQFPELPARQRVDAGGRLVEDQEIRIVDQRAAQTELLLHAAGELARGPAGKGRHAGRVQQFDDPPLALGRGLAEQLAEEIEVLRHAEGRIEVLAEALRHVGDAVVAGGSMRLHRHVAAQRLDVALLNLAHAGDQAEQGRLADAVRSDQADHAFGGDLQAHVIQRGAVAVALRNPFDPGYRLGIRVHSGSFTSRVSGHWRSLDMRT